MYNVSKHILAVLLVGTLLCSTSCSTPETNYQTLDPDDSVTFNTEDSLDPLNYTTYVNKEIDLVLNILSSHMSAGDNIVKGKYPAEDEIAALEADLDLVDEAITSVETFNPPLDYDDDRDAILAKMANAQSSLTEYYDTLKEGDTDGIISCVDLLESDYIALSGAFNLPWE